MAIPSIASRKLDDSAFGWMHNQRWNTEESPSVYDESDADMAGAGNFTKGATLRRNRAPAQHKPGQAAAVKRSRAGLLPNVAPAATLSPFFWISTALLFAGIYTDLVIQLDRSVIPMVSAFPGAALLYLSRGTITPKTIYFLLLPPIAVLGYCTLTPDFALLWQNRVFAAAQVAYAMFLGYAACFSLGRMGRDRLHAIMFILLPVFLLLIFLEITTPFRQTVIDYLENYPREYNLDALADRDSSMGGYRPKLFTSETSYVGVSSFMMLVAYLWSGQGARRYVVFGWYLLAALILVRSPIILLALPVALATANIDRSLNANRSVYNLALIVGLFVTCFFVYIFGSEIFSTRLQKISTGEDYSVTYRTYGSFAVALNVLEKYPFFGVGPGSLTLVKDIITSTLIQLGVPFSAVESDWDKSINNAPSSFLLYFGIVGTAAAIFITSLIIRRDLSRVRLPVIVALFCYSMSYGAVYTPKFLVTVLVIMMLAKLLAAEEPSKRQAPRRFRVLSPKPTGRRLRGPGAPIRMRPRSG